MGRGGEGRVVREREAEVHEDVGRADSPSERAARPDVVVVHHQRLLRRTVERLMHQIQNHRVQHRRKPVHGEHGQHEQVLETILILLEQ